jgi:hypothetical protein
MANVKIEYGSVATAVGITVTLTSLANGSARECTAVDNSSNKYLDALVRVKTKGQSGATDILNVYAYGAAESTTPIYTDGATGTDAAFTAANILNARPVAQIVISGTNAVTAVFSIGKAFDGNLPPKWGLIFLNSSGQALSATGADHAVVYQGVFATVS